MSHVNPVNFLSRAPCECVESLEVCMAILQRLGWTTDINKADQNKDMTTKEDID